MCIFLFSFATPPLGWCEVNCCEVSSRRNRTSHFAGENMMHFLAAVRVACWLDMLNFMRVCMCFAHVYFPACTGQGTCASRWSYLRASTRVREYARVTISSGMHLLLARACHDVLRIVDWRCVSHFSRLVNGRLTRGQKAAVKPMIMKTQEWSQDA